MERERRVRGGWRGGVLYGQKRPRETKSREERRKRQTQGELEVLFVC